MGDTIEDFKARRKAKQERHRKNKRYNIEKIKASGVEYREASPECFIFRGGKRQADFFPSTGRWRDISTNTTHSGGVNKFLAWLDFKETW